MEAERELEVDPEREHRAQEILNGFQVYPFESIL